MTSLLVLGVTSSVVVAVTLLCWETTQIGVLANAVPNVTVQVLEAVAPVVTRPMPFEPRMEGDPAHAVTVSIVVLVETIALLKVVMPLTTKAFACVTVVPEIDSGEDPTKAEPFEAFQYAKSFATVAVLVVTVPLPDPHVPAETVPLALVCKHVALIIPVIVSSLVVALPATVVEASATVPDVAVSAAGKL